MRPVAGILETSLYVADLDRAAKFYRTVFGFELMLAEPRLRALNVATKQVLLLFEKGKSDRPNPVPGGIVPPHDGGGRLHLAFGMEAGAVTEWEHFLRSLGIEIESVVRTPAGATSLYFRDPDGHLIELAEPGLWPLLNPDGKNE